ncbi:hypothetical protein GF340_01425 [Candidatus Peregrinibacteria bacterium]|nr:hypothetical protein [Candidatus Peregrinibacteria bacterium]
MLSEKLKKKPKKGYVNIYWLGGAGFILQSVDVLVVIDPYLSNSCEGKDGSFKRLVPSPISAEKFLPDYVLVSHEHGDHLDILSLPIFAGKASKIIGPGSVMNTCQDLGIDDNNLNKLNRGEIFETEKFSIRTVISDHGEYSPDQIGMIIELEGKCIYYTADTCYKWDLPSIIDVPNNIDVLLVPINGAYGNPNALEATHIASWVNPKCVIPCHYWLFKEHGGNPNDFYILMKEKNPYINVLIAAIGEKVTI